MSSTPTTWLGARLELRRSRLFIGLWWGSDALSAALVWAWWPFGATFFLPVAALLILHGWLGWRRSALMRMQLSLPGDSAQAITLTLGDGRRYQARLCRRAGIAELCCRLDLAGDGLPRTLRQVILFRDCLGEGDWRRLCRYLLAANRGVDRT